MLRTLSDLAFVPSVALLLAALLVPVCGCRREPTSGPSPKAPPVTAANPAPAKTPDVAAPPGEPSKVPPETPFDGFAPEGTGQPTDFRTNRRATLHFAGVSKPLPCTLWFPGQAGESPFTFSMRHDGSGYYDFVFGPDKQPCRLTDPEGRDLAVMDAKFSLEPEGEKRTRSTFRLTLVKP